MSNVRNSRTLPNNLTKSAKRRANQTARIANQVSQQLNQRMVQTVARQSGQGVNTNPSARTARNRRRRIVRRLRRGLAGGNQQLLGNVNQGFYGRYFQLEEQKTLEVSVHKTLQTQFFPQMGVHRGLTKSFVSSALAYAKGSLDLTSSANGTSLSFLFIPSNLGATNMIYYNQSTTGFANPFGTGFTAVAGLFNGNWPGDTVNPSARVVSCTIQIYPEGAPLNQGGAGQVFYASDTALLTNSYASLTQNLVDNLQVSRPWSALEPMILHWTPTDSEVNFIVSPLTDIRANITSSLGFYLRGLPSGAAFHIEYEIGLEYIPNSTYALVVEKASSMIHPDTAYWVSRVAQKHWNPLMLAKYSEYEPLAIAASLETSLAGAMFTGNTLTAIGQVGGGLNVDNRPMDSEEEMSFARPMQQAFGTAPTRLQQVANAALNGAPEVSDFAEGVMESIRDNGNVFSAGALLQGSASYLSRRENRQSLIDGARAAINLLGRVNPRNQIGQNLYDVGI